MQTLLKNMEDTYESMHLYMWYFKLLNAFTF